MSDIPTDNEQPDLNTDVDVLQQEEDRVRRVAAGERMMDGVWFNKSTWAIYKNYADNQKLGFWATTSSLEVKGKISRDQEVQLLQQIHDALYRVAPELISDETINADPPIQWELISSMLHHVAVGEPVGGDND